MSDATGFLHLLKAEPSLLDSAPSDWDARQIEARRMDEIHDCLRCGNRATTALVALADGPRWLDLCWECYDWVRKASQT